MADLFPARDAARPARPRKGAHRALALAVAAAMLLPAADALACSRALYHGDDGNVITGRTMDWKEDMHTNLWAFPRGMKRDGAGGESTPHWTSRYGSVIAAAYDLGAADGMNERGLVANMLFLTGSVYPKADERPVMSLSMWLQYALDNFATVDEVVKALSTESFRVETGRLPSGSVAQLHLSVSDPSGDSAIFEYIDGKLVIHHGPQYQVMTNEPRYDDQLAIETYWRQVGGLSFLPGTNRPEDRFARAAFYIDAIPKGIAKNYISAVPKGELVNQAAASVMGVMRNVSVPLGITTPDRPNVSSTIWRSVSDQKNRVYFFDSATTPNTFWVSLDRLDFSPDQPARKLTLTGGRVLAGEAAGAFEPAAPFTPLAAGTGL